MHKNFAERLDDLIDDYLAGADAELKARYEEIVGDIEVKLMALKEDPPAGL